VIQRQVPLPLPCVNFAQIADVLLTYSIVEYTDLHSTVSILAYPLFGRDGRCVQNLINIHRSIMIYDY